ncbi:N-acetyl-gamma-glutamyl-phosphate reductase [Oscillatoria sp. CS-180]|uniref:N-acetyl-gamma-glutamyl-phosphate reductase n=1 Tax=Oscillatoria sp. CS-180 TaxID=3021720 RepID=UPI00232CBAD5|nr:N-acetyl-gamma-glutamyl-phosphate reductase [Oscillatoria sp. CS-180]MDB9525325.1 N-acetyl-gamma-glutamyl-phosphate reductase [Oscillatoria sp. CS-180]
MGESEQIRVGIVGASGYGGVQLVRLLSEHPFAQITYLGGRSSAGKTYNDIYPHLTVSLVVEAVDIDQMANRCDVVFLSLPNGIACTLAPELLNRGCKVLDLSADYRFADLKTYQAWYGGDRTDSDTSQKAIYGLPELFPDTVLAATLVGCPGCYPTASLLAIAPLLKQGLAQPDSIIIDAKSGTSGGGRQTKEHLLLAEADNSLAAYGVAKHRHTPEIEQICSQLAGREVIVQFTPHLVPMVRGILSTVYANLRDPGLVREDLHTIYSAFYRRSPWITVMPTGTYPQTKWAWGTNRCYLGVEVDARTGRVIVMSAIDNLMKGQAAQAVQCFNLMNGLDEQVGLPFQSVYP